MAADKLALNSPVVIAIVKPEEEETRVNLFIFVFRFSQKEHYVPYLVSSFDRPDGEEGYPRETQILVHGKHPHSYDVGVAQVVDEPANVAEESCVNTVYVSHLHHMLTKRVTVAHLLKEQVNREKSTRSTDSSKPLQRS